MILFFDIDDTLIDSERAHTKAILTLLQDYSLVIEEPKNVISDWLRITNHYLDRYFSGNISLEQQRIIRIKKFWSKFGQQIDNHEAQKIYQQYHQTFMGFCSAFPDAISALRMLENFSLGIISNGTYSDQIFKLNKNNLTGYFKHIIISEKVGYSKPQKEIFHIAAFQVNISPAECIYIGNSYELDYLGSLNAGMKAIWIDRTKSENKSNYECIYSLGELAEHRLIKNEKLR